MLREQLVNACSGMILDTVRSQRGWLNFVSTESQVNRKYFNRKNFQTLKFFRMIRVLYVLAMKMDRDEFSRLGQDLFAEIWDEQDYQGYDLLRITGSVLLITFEVSVLHIVLDSLCTSIGSIVFKCEGKDTNLFSNIQFFNAEK